LKKVIFLIFLSLIFCNASMAETKKTLFDDGVLLFKKGFYKDSIEKFSKLIELSPDNPEAYKNRGVSLMQLDKLDLAMDDFYWAKCLSPELKGLHGNIGVAWYHKKEYDEAIINYNIELETSPDNHVIYFNRAMCHAESGRDEQALKDLSKTLELKPDFYWAICYKADLFAKKKKFTEAMALYETAVRYDQGNQYAQKKLFLLKEKMKHENNRPENETVKNHTATSEYAIQAGAFLSRANALKLKAKLTHNGLKPRILNLEDTKGRTWHLVRSGSYTSRQDAEKALVSLENKLSVKPVIRPARNW
jgi:tetratricopeptide (TPR) repeat protein